MNFLKTNDHSNHQPSLSLALNTWITNLIQLKCNSWEEASADVKSHSKLNHNVAMESTLHSFSTHFKSQFAEINRCEMKMLTEVCTEIDSPWTHELKCSSVMKKICKIKIHLKKNTITTIVVFLLCFIRNSRSNVDLRHFFRTEMSVDLICSMNNRIKIISNVETRTTELLTKCIQSSKIRLWPKLNLILQQINVRNSFASELISAL